MDTNSRRTMPLARLEIEVLCYPVTKNDTVESNEKGDGFDSTSIFLPSPGFV